MEQTANTGGFIREFVPEKISFVSISERDVALAIDQLDHRPRKCLGLVTYREVFIKQLHLPGAPLYLRVEGAGGQALATMIALVVASSAVVSVAGANPLFF